MSDQEAMREISAILDRYIAGDMEMGAAMGRIAYISGRNNHFKRTAIA